MSKFENLYLASTLNTIPLHTYRAMKIGLKQDTTLHVLRQFTKNLRC